MKIEVHYVNPRHNRFLGTRVEVTLRQCNPAEMIPAYRIIRGKQQEVLYRYNDKLWAENQSTSLKQFVYDLQYALYCNLPDDKIIDDEWMAAYLGVGQKLFQQVEEPFYYLATSNCSSVSDMVKVAYNNEGFLKNRRHYAPDERKTALNAAAQIRAMLLDSDMADDTPAGIESIIEILNPDGSVRSQDAPQKRYFRCRHCGERVFADIPIQMDHLIRNHPDTLSLSGYPMDTTEEDVIHANFVEEPKQADNAPMATTSKPNVSKVTPVAVGTCPCQDLRSNKDREWQRDYQKQGDSFPDKQIWDEFCCLFGMKPEDFGREVSCGSARVVRIIGVDKYLVNNGCTASVMIRTRDIASGNPSIFHIKALKKYIPEYCADKRLQTPEGDHFEKAEWNYWIRVRIDLNGLKPDDYERHFFSKGKEFKIVGVSSNASKYPVIAQDVLSGRMQRFAPGFILDQFHSWPFVEI